MGSWDYYCALCGSTFYGGEISSKSRTARLLRARRLSEANRQIKKLAEEGSPIPDELQREADENKDEPGEDENEPMSMGGFDDDHSYDPAVITEKESKWTLDLQCVGLNLQLDSPSKAFLSSIGTGDDYGGLNVHAGDDPNYPDDDFFSAYYDFNVANGGNTVYPFHPKCLDLFRLSVAHESGSGATPVSVDGSWIPRSPDLDMDTLFAILENLGNGFVARLEINYGDPEPPCEQFWESNPGEELFVADPTSDDELVQGMILSVWHDADNHFVTGNAMPFAQTEGSNDLFAKLPFELLLNVISELESSSLLSLLNASPHVHRALEGNSSLWLSHIAKSMPWFFELHEFLNNLTNSNDEDGNGTTGFKADALRDKSLRRFFVWAHHVTTPRVGKTGPFMGVANRRRIWSVCQQVADPYLARLQSPAAVLEDATEEAA